MRYSFILPRKKKILDFVSKISIYFIMSVVAILLIFELFLNFKVKSLRDEVSFFQNSKEQMKKDIEKTQEEIEYLNVQKRIAEEVVAANLLLKDSMKNLFDLVPDQIVLQKALMEKNSLILYGVTPSKDIFDFMLGSPLKSIFHTSNTIFYLDETGWYRFVSTNRIIEERE